MDLEISINEESIKFFSPVARQKLENLALDKSNKLINKIIAEACRIEADRRGEGGTPEITESDLDLATQISQIYHGPNRKKINRILHIVVTILSIITGKLLVWDNSLYMVIASILFVIIGISSYILYNKD